MAQLINEAKRFQKLANIREAEENVTPQQATDVVMQNASKLQNLPAFKDIANKIAEDPKATKQLMDLLGKYGINTNTLSENIDDTAAEKLSLIFAQKADQLTEISDDEDVTGAAGMGFAGLLGGGPLAYYILPKLGLFTHYYTDVWGQTNAVVDTPAMLAGAVLGALLGFFGTYIIGKKMDNIDETVNEAKRFQKLANIKEAEENQSMDPKAMMDAEKKAFQAANSSQFNAAMEKEWAKLSDEDKKKLAQSLSSLNEAVGNDFASFRKMVQKAGEEAGINEDMSDIRAAVGNILGTVGKVNLMGLAGAPGAIIATALGAPFEASYAASFVAGGILWWLGRKIAGEEASEYVDETVNEALAKFRKAGK